MTEKVIGCAIEVHRILGPGLLESAYEECMAFELKLAGFTFERQVELPVRYKSVDLNCGYRVDLLISKSLIVELKTAEALLPIHEAQLLTYLRLSGVTTGLLINFNVPVLKNGLRRMKP